MIWIFGDSFSTSNNSGSWVRLLNESVKNFSNNGSSEYRILKNYNEQQHNISSTDIIIFVHTSPTRIFLKDDRIISSRTLESHTKCDIIINDIFVKGEQEYIKILESIWDEEYFNDIFDLIVDKLQSIPNSLHITFFETNRKDIVQLNHAWITNPGNINHMDPAGNCMVVDTIRRLIYK